MGIFGKIFRKKKQSGDDKSSVSGGSRRSKKAALNTLNNANNISSSSSALHDSALNASFASARKSHRGASNNTSTVSREPEKASSAANGRAYGSSSAYGNGVTSADRLLYRKNGKATNSSKPVDASATTDGSPPATGSASPNKTPRVSPPRNSLPSQPHGSSFAASPHGWGGSTSSVSVEQTTSPQLSHSQSLDENIDVAHLATSATSTPTAASTSPEEADGSNATSSRLSAQQLRKWDQQQHVDQQPESGINRTAPIYRMSMPMDIPKQQMIAMDDMNRSDASSSSFNLSTDAEDSEYEALRKRGVIPTGPLNSTLDSSVISATTYSTDNDPIFPALQTDDEMTQSTAQSSSRGENPPRIKPVMPLSMASMLGRPEDSDNMPTPTSAYGAGLNPMLVPQGDGDGDDNGEPGRIQLSKMTNETDEDFRAWTLSPSTASSTTAKSLSVADKNPSYSMASNDIASPPASATDAARNLTSPNDFKQRSASGALTIDPQSAASTSQGQRFFGSSPTSKSLSVNSRNTPNGPIRNFTSPRSQASSDFSYEDEFADFADFAKFGKTQFGHAAKGSAMTRDVGSPDQPSQRYDSQYPDLDSGSEHKIDAPDVLGSGNDSRGPYQPSQTNAAADESRDEIKFVNNEGSMMASAQGETSLSELLAQAKNKSRTRSSRHGKASSASVSSAPVLTTSYLRQQHNLGARGAQTPNENTSRGSNDPTGSRPSANSFERSEATSVSDIISSLEATNQSRTRNASSSNSVYRAGSHRSVGDTGAVAVSRSVKERMRERRQREREASGRVHRSKSSEVSSSETSDNDQDDQDWLFDGVTGALGPRGIAADLESLSGRSKSSNGNRSHKSHKSHRSHKSRTRARSSRHHNHSNRQSSGSSVDSRGSRHSRSSRYSHRSTKSYISQMSEQSRSVANDLLRLEMQLAMVGSSGQAGSGDDSGRASSSSVTGSRYSSHHHHRLSRDSRKSRTKSSTSSAASSPLSSTRRTQVTVLAPPGKLGIILANRADSKGTVVSGVRTSSVLADKVSPGDRIVAIDGEDVSRMTVSEITTIMARKSDFDRTLSVLTIPKSLSADSSTTYTGNGRSGSSSGVTSPDSTSPMGHSTSQQHSSMHSMNRSYESYSQYRR